MNPAELGGCEKEGLPLYPIGIAAELLGTTDQTLRLYEKHGLVLPARRNKNRFYSDNDIKLLRCVRELIHSKKISIEGVKRLLEYAPCWDIQGCTPEVRDACCAFVDRSKPCWELVHRHCKDGKGCEKCVVFMSKDRHIKQRP